VNHSEALSRLGLAAGASEDDIQKAFRKLAMKHHPDRGGNEEEFKSIKAAYELLTGKGPQPQAQQGGWSGGMPDMSEVFKRAFGGAGGHFNFHFHDMRGGQAHMERIFNVTFNITIEEAFNGCSKNVNLAFLPGHIEQVDVPAGICPGQVIKIIQLENSGEKITCQLVVNIDTHGTVVVWPNDPARMYGPTDTGGNMHTTVEVPVITMMTGGWVKVRTIDGGEVEVRVPAGMNAGSFLKVKEKGYWSNPRQGRRGDLLLKVHPIIPKVSDLTVDELRQLAKIAEEGLKDHERA
jgi:DnaJ-class molecular chaperone